MGIKIEPKNQCPLDGFKPCRQIECAWFAQIRGNNPQTSEDVDEWACAVAWLPMLTINTANQARQTAAAVESFRNEMVKDNREHLAMLSASPRTQGLERN